MDAHFKVTVASDEKLPFFTVNGPIAKGYELDNLIRNLRCAADVLEILSKQPAKIDATNLQNQILTTVLPVFERNAMLDSMAEEFIETGDLELQASAEMLRMPMTDPFAFAAALQNTPSAAVTKEDLVDHVKGLIIRSTDARQPFLVRHLEDASNKANRLLPVSSVAGRLYASINEPKYYAAYGHPVVETHVADAETETDSDAE